MLSANPVIDHHQLSSLLAATAVGDKLAYQNLYQSSSPMMFGLLMRMLKRRDMAEDALQDCYIKIWQRAATYDPTKGEPLAWLMTVARHQALDVLRTKRPEVDMPEDDEEQPFSMQDHAQSCEESAIAREGLRQLEPCLNKLKRDSQLSILLAYYGGYTHEEISIRLGQPLGTVKSWVRRGLGDLRECLERSN